MSKWLYLSLALALILSGLALYFKGRHDERSAIETARLQANITGFTETIKEIRKVENAYDHIFQEIRKTPPVSPACPAPPAIRRALDLLPDGSND